MGTESEIIERIALGELGEWQTEEIENEEWEQTVSKMLFERASTEAPSDTPVLPMKPKGEFVYTKEELFAIRQTVANLPRPDDLPPIYCRDEPGNLAENKLDDKFRGAKGSRIPTRERKPKEGGPMWANNNKTDEPFTGKSKRSSKEEDGKKIDESIVLSPPRKTFPSSQLTSPTLSRKSISENNLAQASPSTSRYVPPHAIERVLAENKSRSFEKFAKRSAFGRESDLLNDEFSFNSPQAAQFEADKLKYQQKMNEMKKENPSESHMIDVDSLFAPTTDLNEQSDPVNQGHGFFDNFEKVVSLPPHAFVSTTVPPTMEPREDGKREETLEEKSSRGLGRWFRMDQNENVKEEEKREEVEKKKEFIPTQPQQKNITPIQSTNEPSTTPQKLTLEMLFQSVQASNTPLPALPSIHHTPKPISTILSTPSTPPTTSSHIPPPTTPTSLPSSSSSSSSFVIPNGPQIPTKSHTPIIPPTFPPLATSRPYQATSVKDKFNETQEESISFITSLLSKNHVHTPPPMNQPPVVPMLGPSPLMPKQVGPPPRMNPMKQVGDGVSYPYPTGYYQQPYGPFVPPPTPSIPGSGGLEKWFGNNIYGTNSMPPLPNNIKMVSVEEIEKSHVRKT